VAQHHANDPINTIFDTMDKLTMVRWTGDEPTEEPTGMPMEICTPTVPCLPGAGKKDNIQGEQAGQAADT
jgi:hypothetical protein